MKWLAGLLLLLNLMLFAYFQLAGPAPVRGPQAPIAPESITLVAPDELARIPPPAPPAPAAPAAACYQWGGFAPEQEGRAHALLAELGLAGHIHSAPAALDDSGYWVYIPPLASAREAQARARALRELGLRDTYIVREARWRHAISLGVFKVEAQAQRWLEELRARGVNDAVKGLRNPDPARSVFLLNLLPAPQAAALEARQAELQGAALSAVACP